MVPPYDISAAGPLAELTPAGIDKTLVLGIGGSGSQLLKRVYEQHALNPDLSFLAVNSDYKELRLLQELGIEMFELKRRVELVPDENADSPVRDLSMFNGQGAGGNPTVGQHMMQENAEDFLKKYADLESALDGDDSRFCRVIMLYGYGGGTGAGASLVIAEKLKERYPYLQLYCFVVTPLMEGSAERMSEIVSTVEKMEKLVDVFFPIDQEGMYRAYGKLSQTEASAKLYDVALKNINAFLLMIGVPVEKNIDAADLARGLGVRGAGEESNGQCAIAGYVEGKLDEMPAIQGLENVPNGALLHLLYAAVPGEFMFLRNVRGARVCIIKVVYGEGVCPSMNELNKLKEQVQCLAGATASDFTPTLSYGPSKAVPEGEYKFAVFFSQFQADNAMTLSKRFQHDYNEWSSKTKNSHVSLGNILEFNTFREEEPADSINPRQEEFVEGAAVESENIVGAQRVIRTEGARNDAQSILKYSIASAAQPARVVMPPVIEEYAVPEKKARRRVAAAEMATHQATKEVGMPTQRQLDIPIQEETLGAPTYNPLYVDPKKAAQAWAEARKQRGGLDDGE